MYLSLIGWRLASREDMYIVRAPDFILAKKHFRKCRFFLDLDIRRVRQTSDVWRIPWSIEALAKSHKTQKMAFVKMQNNDIKYK